MAHQQHSRLPVSMRDNDPQFFDYDAEDSEHLIAEFEPNGFWDQSTQGPAPFDFGYSADQCINAYPPPPTFSGSPSFTVSSRPLGAGLSSASDTPYSSTSSPLISAPHNLRLYSQQNSPTLYSEACVSPNHLQSSDSYSGPRFGLGTPESLVVPSPVATDISLPDPELSGFANEFATGDSAASVAGSSDSMSRTKRARTAMEQDVGAAWSAPAPTGRPLLVAGPVAGSRDVAGGKGKSKLRSASRASKNIAHKLDETSEERRTRNAHNIVEKQYRSRLNARFEGLLNVLPPSLRSSGTADGATETRLSKGDVLDMSTTYIRTLENQCSQLEKEHEELTSNIDQLHALLASDGRSNRDGFGGGGS